MVCSLRSNSARAFSSAPARYSHCFLYEPSVSFFLNSSCCRTLGSPEGRVSLTQNWLAAQNSSEQAVRACMSGGEREGEGRRVEVRDLIHMITNLLLLASEPKSVAVARMAFYLDPSFLAHRPSGKNELLRVSALQTFWTPVIHKSSVARFLL